MDLTSICLACLYTDAFSVVLLIDVLHKGNLLKAHPAPGLVLQLLCHLVL